MWKCILFLSLLSALPGWAAKAFQFSDDFRGYAAGSDGAPGWETETIDWAMGTGAFTYHGAERDFALPGKAPLGTAVTVTATLTLQEAVGAGWKVAGVCVRQNAQNFWHLAFVEGPDADGKHHFVELSEMRNGVWNAHLEAATRLTPRADNNGNFAWQYHHPYLCTLAMTADGISGTVCEADGTADARLGFAFDGKAVTNGRPGLSAAGLATDYAAFSSNVDGAVAAPPAVVLPPYPLRGGTLRGKATGYFHVEQVQQAWWFIDPRGVAMVDLGVDHVNYQAHWCEKLGYAPYHRNCEQRYGGEAGWAAHALERLQQWGFTSLG